MTRPDAIESLQAGLRAAGLRQAAIASNVANLQTPGFRRGVVAFEQAFAEALHGGEGADLRNVEMAVLRPGGPVGDSGVNDVSLDQEVGEMVPEAIESIPVDQPKVLLHSANPGILLLSGGAAIVGLRVALFMHSIRVRIRRLNTVESFL